MPTPAKTPVTSIHPTLQPVDRSDKYLGAWGGWCWKQAGKGWYALVNSAVPHCLPVHVEHTPVAFIPPPLSSSSDPGLQPARPLQILSSTAGLFRSPSTPAPFLSGGLPTFPGISLSMHFKARKKEEALSNCL